MGSIEGNDTTTSSQERPQSSPGDDEDIYQDVVSQFPFLNGYTHLILGFQLAPDTSRDGVVAALRHGIDQLVSQMPWLGGQVVHVPGGPGDSGVYHPAPWPADATPNDIVRVKDCDDLMPPMARLVRAHGPIEQLDGQVLAPWPGLPLPHGLKGTVPIIALQANFIKGGLLLNSSLHHNIIDGTGIIQFMRLLATAMKGGEISAEDIEQANRDRTRVLPLLRRGEPVKDHSHLRRPPGFVPNNPATPPKWCYFKLPLASLRTLQKSATSTSPSAIPVSENDVICAFCWQRISAVRLTHATPKLTHDTVSRFLRAIDGRMVMGVPFSYMGHMVYHASTRLPLGQVVSGPLAHVAQTLRRELNAANTTWGLRSYATVMAHTADKSTLLYGGVADCNIDLGATGMVTGMGDSREGASAVPSYGPLLGEAKFLRRPRVTPLPGSITIQSAESGSIPIALCLPELTIEGLKKDAQWKQYMRHIG